LQWDGSSKTKKDDNVVNVSRDEFEREPRRARYGCAQKVVVVNTVVGEREREKMLPRSTRTDARQSLGTRF